MKLNKNFVLRQVADTWVVLPIGDASINFYGMLTLNESGAMLWRVLEQNGDRDALIEALIREYTVDIETAASDVDAFLNKLINAGCML